MGAAIPDGARNDQHNVSGDIARDNETTRLTLTRWNWRSVSVREKYSFVFNLLAEGVTAKLLAFDVRISSQPSLKVLISDALFFTVIFRGSPSSATIRLGC
jgi:hypothetical protein